MNCSVKSTDYAEVIADGFSVLVDPKPPVIGLKIDPVAGGPFIVPIEFGAAKQLAVLIMRTLLLEAPELFRGMF